jgi:hypothetical protein
VYRELATELKTTQTMVESLTRQNQQLTRQNQLLRQEIHRFVQSAEQLGQFAGVPPQESIAAPDSLTIPSPEDPSDENRFTPPSSPSPTQDSALAPRERGSQKPPRSLPPPQPEAAAPRVKLFTEQRDDFRRSPSSTGPGQDLGNLWLVTTILLVVFTAFGAGFLIMRPLLNR